MPTVRVLREIVLPDSHVEPWCKRLIDTVQPWARSFSRNRQPLEISFYGDANGGARSPSSSGNTPWDVVESFMQQEPEYHAHMMYKKQNPTVLDRINVMNGMLCKADGQTRRLFIDPSCTELITDLEEVKWKVDAHGVTLPDIDNRNPKRTHVSDALGYYVETEHGSGSNKIRFRQELLVSMHTLRPSRPQSLARPVNRPGAHKSLYLFRRDSNARLTLFLRYLNANSPLRRVPLYPAIWGAKYFTQNN